MKLFAKWLPVEGEIKEGDWAQDDNIYHPNNKVQILELIHPNTSFTNARISTGIYSTKGLAKLKKVKLFLCSRDVQIGDKLKYKNEIFHVKYKTGIKNGLAAAQLLVNSGHAFKVVGEISPDAVWVKEGDEFDEYEKWWFSTKYNHSIMKYVEGDEGKAMFTRVGEKSKLICKLKCSQCKTFH